MGKISNKKIIGEDAMKVKEESNKLVRKIKYVVITIAVCALALIGVGACNKNPVITNTPVGEKIITTKNPTKEGDLIVTPGPTDPKKDAENKPADTEITEAKYKEMVEEKLEKIIKENFDAANTRYSRVLTNFNILKIDKTNGIIYGYGDVSGVGEKRFIVATLSESLNNCKNYEDVNNKVKNYTKSDVLSVPAQGNISTLTTSSSYNNFLNSVVTDAGFKQTLDNAGISRPININEWKDVASVVNAKIYNSDNIDITFVDLSNEKTITIRVNVDLNLQESSSVENQVVNTTNKTKNYTLISSQDFSTFAAPEIAQTIELGK